MNADLEPLLTLLQHGLEEASLQQWLLQADRDAVEQTAQQQAQLLGDAPLQEGSLDALADGYAPAEYYADYPSRAAHDFEYARTGPDYAPSYGLYGDAVAASHEHNIGHFYDRGYADGRDGYHLADPQRAMAYALHPPSGQNIRLTLPPPRATPAVLQHGGYHSYHRHNAQAPLPAGGGRSSAYLAQHYYYPAGSFV